MSWRNQQPSGYNQYVSDYGFLFRVDALVVSDNARFKGEVALEHD